MAENSEHTTRLVRESEYLGALLLAVEHGLVRPALLGTLSPEPFVSKHAAATFQELARAASAGQTLTRHDLVAAPRQRRRHTSG